VRYVPRLLNKYKVFQHLNSVLSGKTNEKLCLKIEHFLYRASCVLASLERMYESEKHSVTLARAYIKQIRFPKDKKIALSVEPLFEVYAQIPAALSQIVNMQN